MSFQLVFIYLFIYLFTYSLYLIIYSFPLLFLIINQLLCSSFSTNLPSIFKHYLVLLSSISFSVILSKYSLFLLIYLCCKFN